MSRAGRFVVLWSSLSLLIMILFTGCYEEKPSESNGSSGAAIELTGEWQSPLPQANKLNALWMDSSSSVIFAVGDFGTALSLKGQVTTLYDSLTIYNLTGVWAASDSSAYACSDAGEILHFDGNQWSEMTSGYSGQLFAIWGLSDDNIYAVGNSGTILHYDGSSWSTMTTPASRAIFSIWGASADDIYAVGLTGLILHYDGSTWDSISTVTTGNLISVWGFGADTVVAVGENAKIAYYDGNIWQTLTTDLEDESLHDFVAVWGLSSDGVYAATKQGEIYRLNFAGAGLPNPQSVSKGIYGLTGVDPDVFYFCGGDGILYRSTAAGVQTQILPRVSSTRLRAIWGESDFDVYAAGDSGQVLAKSGTGWRKMVQNEHNIILELWGFSGNAIFAAAGNKILRFNGDYWSVSYHADDTLLANYVSVWGLTPWDVYAAGDYGKVVHFDGSTWQELSTGSDKNISAIRGTGDGLIFTAGEDGVILKYDGTSWVQLYSDSRFYFQALLVRGANRLVAVGQNGLAVHYDGVSFRTLLYNTGVDLLDVWGTRSDNVFAVGRGGAILYYDGDYWTRYISGTNNDLFGIWGADRNGFYVVGDGGTIRRYTVTYTN